MIKNNEEVNTLKWSYLIFIYILPLIVLTFYSMLTSGFYGSYSLYIFQSYATGGVATVRGYTILGFFALFFILFFGNLRKYPQIFRCLYSGLIPFIGLMWFEFWHNFGGTIAVGGADYLFASQYWGKTTIGMVCGLYILHNFCPVLIISKKKICSSVPIIVGMLLFWGYMVNSGWYQIFGLWQGGIIDVDPHNIVNLITKEMGIFVLFPFVSNDGYRKELR